MHLFVLLTVPYDPIGQVIMACVCSVPEPPGHYDGSCILNIGDHDFISHDSYVSYRHCREEPARKLIAGVASGEFVDKGLMPEETFERILAGAMVSPFIKPYVQKILKSN